MSQPWVIHREMVAVLVQEQRASSPSSDSLLNIWMGTRHSIIISNSSNWKEIRILLQTLQNEQGTGDQCVKYRWILYLTNNMVTYDVFR